MKRCSSFGVQQQFRTRTSWVYWLENVFIFFFLCLEKQKNEKLCRYDYYTVISPKRDFWIIGKLFGTILVFGFVILVSSEQNTPRTCSCLYVEYEAWKKKSRTQCCFAFVIFIRIQSHMYRCNRHTADMHASKKKCKKKTTTLQPRVSITIVHSYECFDVYKLQSRKTVLFVCYRLRKVKFVTPHENRTSK